MEIMNQSDKKSPPDKPKGLCEICGEPLEYQVNPAIEEGDAQVTEWLMGMAMFYWQVDWTGQHAECKKKIDAKEQEEARKKAEKEANAIREKAKEKANLKDKLYASMTFDNFKIQDENKWAYWGMKSWWYGKPPVGLLGEAGSGKTHLMVALAWKILDSGNRVYFANCPQLMTDLRKSQFDSGRTYDGFLKKIQEIPVLLLDDVGAEKETEWVCQQLFLIFNYRVQNDLPTFITSNCSEDQLNDRLNTRIFDRLKVSMAFVPITGINYRSKKNEELKSQLWMDISKHMDDKK